jgi:ABC-type uncharacterized transport system ATPase subunit
MKQRLILAMALLHEPDILFLDEPTSGLDVQSTHLILSMLRDLNAAGTTIFLTTHNMDEANRLCDRVAVMRTGRIVALDAPERLKMAIERLHTVEVSFDSRVEEGALAALAVCSPLTYFTDIARYALVGTHTFPVIADLASLAGFGVLFGAVAMALHECTVQGRI